MFQYMFGASKNTSLKRESIIVFSHGALEDFTKSLSPYCMDNHKQEMFFF